ncbi:MAG TPA: hypothetical protein VMD74_03430 [Candidatus Methylomirabilis sp.]|nr:hypothetical protein [Candidatus Methylomirabilis sp.]
MPLSLVEQFDKWLDSEMKPRSSAAKRILFEVVHNLMKRHGFHGAWDDMPANIRDEMLRENLAIIQKNLKGLKR